MNNEPHKHLRRLERVWIRNPIYFLTVCTEQRKCILANEMVAAILSEEWQKADLQHGWLVGRYVIMPEHVHFFCVARGDAKLLSEFIRLWKQWTGKGIKQLGPRLASAATEENAITKTGPRLTSAATEAGTDPTRIWQREFFDHVLRSEENYAQKWEYVRSNPVRAGLVARAEDWPYQGEIYPLTHL